LTGAAPIVDLRVHSRMIVVTSDCDLLKDYTERQKPQANWNSAHLLEHVLLCDVFAYDEIAHATPTAFGRHEWKRIRLNQYERYHRFPAAEVQGSATIAVQAPIAAARRFSFRRFLARFSPLSTQAQGAAIGQGAVTAAALPELFLDFKKCTGIPPESLYACQAASQISRAARVPTVFLQDLTQRLYSYLSRVGPDFD
jgi:hypothetical protein